MILTESINRMMTTSSRRWREIPTDPEINYEPLMLRDRETGSVWRALTGYCVEGRVKGTKDADDRRADRFLVRMVPLLSENGTTAAARPDRVLTARTFDLGSPIMAGDDELGTGTTVEVLSMLAFVVCTRG